MKIKSIPYRPETIASLLCLLITAGYVACGWLPQNRWWGINHLCFIEGPAKYVLAIGAIAAIFLVLFERRKPFLGRPAWLPRKLGLPLSLGAALVLTIIFRVAVHSLGDGYQRAFEIAGGKLYQPTQLLDFLVHVGMFRLLRLAFPLEAVTAMAITSILAGLVFVIVLTKFSPLTGPSRVVFLAALLSLGCSQLFFGYAESYTIVYLFTLWYLFLLFAPRERQAPFSLVMMTYLLAAFSHQMGMILLLPSLIYYTSARYGRGLGRAVAAAAAAVAGTAPFWSVRLINHILGIEEIRGWGTYFLSPGGDYGIFSGAHLFDILNQMLLAAPVALFLLPFFPRAISAAGRRIWPALSVILPATLFLLVVNPELTLSRDWDAFSLPVAAAAVTLMLLLFGCRPQDSRISNRLAALVLPALVMTASWVVLNSQTAAHLRRAEYLLDGAAKGRRYGWELLAHYYYNQGDHTAELRMLERIPSDERTARVYGKLAQACWLMGRQEQAYDYAVQGVRLPDVTRLTLLMAGVTAFDRNEYLRAVPYLRGAADMAPHDQPGLCKLGEALVMADSLDAALSVFGRAMALDRSTGRPYLNIALVYYRKQEYALAERFCREGLQREPADAGGQQLWQKLQALKRPDQPEP